MNERPGGRRSRIVYFSDAPYTGGAEKYLFLLASHLDRERFEPIAVINRNPALEPLRRWMTDAGIEVHEVSLRLPFSVAGAGACVSLLRRLKASVLHLNLPGPFDAQFSLVAPLARMAGVRRIVSTEHLPMVPTFAKARLLKSFGTHWIGRVITVSEDNRRYLERIHGIGAEKIRVVHIGIPDREAGGSIDLGGELGLPEDTVLLLTAGSLERRKGHDIALEALARLPGRFHLAVAGEGELRPDYERLAAALGIERRVHFLGRRSDMPALLRSVDMMVHPSRMDATPYVIVEALAAGLPVIASNVYGIPELVEDGISGLLVPPDDAGELVRAISSLADDPERRGRIAAAARARFESRFTMETHVKGTIAVYEELLGGGEGAR